MHTFKKKKSDGQKDNMRFLTLVTGNFHGILHHVIALRRKVKKTNTTQTERDLIKEKKEQNFHPSIY